MMKIETMTIVCLSLSAILLSVALYNKHKSKPAQTTSI
jgi:hypothetical protein